jgi:hypothetical protein
MSDQATAPRPSKIVKQACPPRRARVKKSSLSQKWGIIGVILYHQCGRVCQAPACEHHSPQMSRTCPLFRGSFGRKTIGGGVKET